MGTPDDRERKKRRDEKPSGERRKRGLGFWRHSSLCINTTGSHRVASLRLPLSLRLLQLGSAASSLRFPGDTNFIIFFRCPLHAFYHSSRGPATGRDSSPSYVTTRNEVLACSRCLPFLLPSFLRVSQLPCILVRSLCISRGRENSPVRAKEFLSRRVFASLSLSELSHRRR